MLIKYQKLLTNRNCQNFLMFLQGVKEEQLLKYNFLPTTDEIKHACEISYIDLL